MADLETRLSEALRGTAERAPHPGDLASGARARLRRRRRTTAATVAAAVAVVTIPVAVTLVGGERPPDRRESTVADPVPSDWRVESYRDLTLRVPPQWTWGSGPDWCVHGHDPEVATPQVSRPGGVVPAIGCRPTYGYGVHFEEPPSGALPPGTEGAVQQYHGDRYPDGAWIGHASTGHAGVWVVTDDRRLTRQVLDTAQPIRAVDANGCADSTHALLAREGASMSVCRYDAGGRLEQSELLTGEELTRAAEAVRKAPRPTDTASLRCRGLSRRGPVVLLASEDLRAEVRWRGRCPGLRVAGEVPGVRQLTAEVLYWVLSPGWSGAVDGDVPLPERLRRE